MSTKDFRVIAILLWIIVLIPKTVLADDQTAKDTGGEILNRLKNMKKGETAESILGEYARPKTAGQTQAVVSASLADDLSPCRFEPFKIEYLCDARWVSHWDERGIVYEISDSPFVTMSIRKISDKIKFLEQINKNDIASAGQYEDNFRLGDAVIGNEKVKMVSGFSKQDPKTRYLDYYVLNQGTLYGVLFSVDPKESWDSYRFLIKNLAGSIAFKEKP